VKAHIRSKPLDAARRSCTSRYCANHDQSNAACDHKAKAREKLLHVLSINRVRKSFAIWPWVKRAFIMSVQP
jgi:hypothetical protein